MGDPPVGDGLEWKIHLKMDDNWATPGTPILGKIHMKPIETPIETPI